MKKWMKGLAVGLLALALAACGDAAKEPAEAKPGTEETKKSELTLEEVFDKAQAVGEELESMHADMNIEQHISSDTGMEMDSTIKMKMDFIVEPLAMYQIMEMSMGEEGSMKTEMYMTDEGFFMKNPEADEWMKLPADLYEQAAASMNTGEDATVDYASLKDYMEDFKFEQNDNEYILKLTASGEKFNELIKEELESSGIMDGLSAEELDALEDMKVHQLEYEIFIDKETFETTAFNMLIDMEMSAEGETVQIKQDIASTISQINEIPEIQVPQEVLDNAVEY